MFWSAHSRAVERVIIRTFTGRRKSDNSRAELALPRASRWPSRSRNVRSKAPPRARFTVQSKNGSDLPLNIPPAECSEGARGRPRPPSGQCSNKLFLEHWSEGGERGAVILEHCPRGRSGMSPTSLSTFRWRNVEREVRANF